jgi:hypothetical protein
MENEFIQVQDHPDLVRDKHSTGIINTNRNAYERAVRRAQSAQEERDALRNATREINNIKCEMHEIKSLLIQLVSKE